MSKLTATTALLMTPEEKALFRACESRLLHKVGDAELRTQIERARHLRKKYDDLLQRERATAQSEGLEPDSRAAQGNPATVRKATAFTYVVAQFEADLERRAGAIDPAARTATTTEAGAKTATVGSSKKKAPKGASAKTPTSETETTRPKNGARGSKAGPSAVAKLDPKESGSRAVAGKKSRGGVQNGVLRGKQVEQRQKLGPAQRQIGHAAARGRRQQARSDSRH